MSTVQVMARESSDLAEQLQQTQNQLAALKLAVASGNGADVARALSSPADAHSPPSAATPQVMESSATSSPGPRDCLRDCIKLGNGRELYFSKQTIPDPPAVSFARDLPLLMRIWDDKLPGWSPSEAVLRIEGEPIALKYWPDLYRYGKSRQWGGVKKSWAHWRVSVAPSLTWHITYCLVHPGCGYQLAKAHRGQFLAQILL